MKVSGIQSERQQDPTHTHTHYIYVHKSAYTEAQQKKGSLNCTALVTQGRISTAMRSTHVTHNRAFFRSSLVIVMANIGFYGSTADESCHQRDPVSAKLDQLLSMVYSLQKEQSESQEVIRSLTKSVGDLSGKVTQLQTTRGCSTSTASLSLKLPTALSVRTIFIYHARS